jgi:hypothetical protein
MEDQRGHTGPMFKTLAPNGFAQCGWHAPDGTFYPAPSFLHDAVAQMLWGKFFPEAFEGLATDALLAKEWVRAACDGYYEVARFEGRAKTVVLDLVAVLDPSREVAVDVIGNDKRICLHGLTAQQFYDKWL